MGSEIMMTLWRGGRWNLESYQDSRSCANNLSDSSSVIYLKFKFGELIKRILTSTFFLEHISMLHQLTPQRIFMANEQQKLESGRVPVCLQL